MSSAPADSHALESLAREVFSLFPTCVRCGRAIERYEDADVRIFSFRVLHRDPCVETPNPEPLVPGP